MDLLLLGDLHYDLRQLDWVLAEADDHDVVVLAGDLLDISSTVPIDAQVPVVLGYLERLAARATTVVCSGNHDLTGRDAEGEKAALWLTRAEASGVVIDDATLVVPGARITVCPWWDGPQGRARLERELTEQAAAAGDQADDRWIWVYHWPPSDLPVSWTGRQSYGDADLAGWIARFSPSLVLSGHVHQSPWVDGGSWIARSGATWIINAGRQIGPVPSHAVVDLDAWSARWTSYEDSGEQRLDQ